MSQHENEFYAPLERLEAMLPFIKDSPDGRWVYQTSDKHCLWFRVDWPNFCVCMDDRVNGRCTHWEAYLVKMGQLSIELLTDLSRRKEKINSGIEDRFVDPKSLKPKLFGSSLPEALEVIEKGKWRAGIDDAPKLSEILTRGDITPQETERLKRFVQNRHNPAMAVFRIEQILVSHPSTRHNRAIQELVIEEILWYTSATDKEAEPAGKINSVAYPVRVIIDEGLRAMPEVWAEALGEFEENSEWDLVKLVERMPDEALARWPKRTLVKLLQIKNRELRRRMIVKLGGQSKLEEGARLEPLGI